MLKEMIAAAPPKLWWGAVGAAGFVLVIVCVVLVASSGGSPPPVDRSAFAYDATWRCTECGESVVERAAAGHKKCPKCGKDTLYVTQEWKCPQHGVVRFAFEYGDGAIIKRIKVGTGEWQNYDLDKEADLYVCPKCKEYLMPVFPSRTSGT